MTKTNKNPCYACGRKLGPNPYVADTRDSQFVYIGSECFKYVRTAGEAGYQPPKGGPRLYTVPAGLTQDQLNDAHISAREYLKSLK